MFGKKEILAALAEVTRRLDHIESLITRQGATIMTAIDDLTTQVAQNTNVESSAVLLIQGIAAQLTAAGTDPAKLTALTQKLTQSASSLAAAVAANTPAAPPGPAARRVP